MSAYSSKPRLGQGQVKDYKALAGKVTRRDNGRRQSNQQPGQQDDVLDGPRADYKNAAIKILKQEKRLMNVGEITKLALDRRLISKAGRNHEATMNSLLFSDVKQRPDVATFFKHRQGLFGLRSWIGEPWLERSLRETGPSEDEVSVERQASMCPPPPKRRKWSHKVQNASPARSEGAGTSTAETDSEDRNSNINLLLEAADEIDRTENWPEQIKITTNPPKPVRGPAEERHRGPHLTITTDPTPDTNPTPDITPWPNPNASEQDTPEDTPASSQAQPAMLYSFNRPPRPTLNRSMRRSIRSTTDANSEALPSPLPSPGNLVLQIPNGLLPANAATLQFSPMGYTFLANHLGSPIASPLTLAGPTLFSPQPSPAAFDASCFPGVSPTIMPLTPLGGPLIDVSHAQFQGLAMQNGLSAAQVQHPPPTTFGDRGLEVRGVALSALANSPSEAAVGAGTSKTVPHIINLDLPDFDVSHDEENMRGMEEEEDVHASDPSAAPDAATNGVAKTTEGPSTPPVPDQQTTTAPLVQDAQATQPTNAGAVPMEGVTPPPSDAPVTLPSRALAPVPVSNTSAVHPPAGNNPALPMPISNSPAVPVPFSNTSAVAATGVMPSTNLDTATVPLTSTPAQTHDTGAVIPTRTPTPGLNEESSVPATPAAGDGLDPLQTVSSATLPPLSASGVHGQDAQAVPGTTGAPQGVTTATAVPDDPTGATTSNAAGAGDDAQEASGPREAEIVHPAQINLTRQHIHLLEKTLGYNHPTVGKAYIYLSRLLMNEGSRWSVTMAKRALYRSWNILASLKTQLGTTDPPLAFNDFTYLLRNLEHKDGSRPGTSPNPSNSQTTASQPFSPLASPATHQATAQLNPLFMQRIVQQPSGLGPAVAALASPDMRLHGPISPMAIASPVGSLAASAAAYRMLLGQQGTFTGFAPLASN